MFPQFTKLICKRKTQQQPQKASQIFHDKHWGGLRHTEQRFFQKIWNKKNGEFCLTSLEHISFFWL